MAIQIRRGNDAEWESNKSNIVAGEPAVTLDTGRFFVGKGTGIFAEMSNIENLAEAFDSSATYEVGDYVTHQGKLWSFTNNHQGAWSANDVVEVTVKTALEDITAKTVPTSVRSAIYTLLEKAVYTETGLSDEKQIVRSWASEATFLSISPNTLNLIEDTPQTITASVSPSYATVVWESTDESVATVVGGIVTGVSNGTCMIIASAGNLTASCEVTVTGFAELVSISATYTPVGVVYTDTPLNNLKDNLVVTANYDDSSSVVLPSTTYALSGTLESGTTTITVTYHGVTTTFSVTVLDTVPGGYKRIEYVERPTNTATNSGYNSTYFMPNGTDTVNIKLGGTLLADAGTVAYFLICHQKTTDNSVGFGVNAQGTGTIGAFDGTAVTVQPNGGSSIIGQMVDIVCEKTSSGITLSDGTHTNTVTSTPRAITSNMYVFAMAPTTGTTLQYPIKGRIHYLAIYEAGVLKVNFVPCKRDSDGQVGFYDTVANAFRFSSAYTGGAEV